MMKIRLQVALAKAGIAARRKAAELIRLNRVRVNGEVVKEAGFRVDPEKDRITFDDKPISLGEVKEYYILNKPRGVLSTAKDERGRKTVLECIRGGKTRLYPVGRLDRDTSGLILLTNDGRLTYRLTHPKFGIKRIYEVTVKGFISDREVLRLKNGVNIDGKPARAEEIFLKKRAHNFTALRLALGEGRKREVRRLFEALGREVSALKRIAYGPLKLRDLPEGAFRPLTKEEINRLKNSVGIYETR